ncbi:MAG: dehypoxanthine futalosine cyclase [Planctomycetes bacterium]|nr:dehypoxanthine futalosine cyclase [Planctomycetota bacterium]
MSELQAILDRVADGGRMTPEEGLRLYVEAPNDALRDAAVAVRNRHVDPGTVTFLIDRNVNYTNVCTTDCKFCEFYRPPGHAETYVLDRDVLRVKLSELAAAGGTRVLLQGGHHPDLRIEWYEELLSWMRDEFPQLQRDAFSPPEIEHIAHVEGLTFAEVLERLKAAGLDGVPGGGGEILDDEIRQIVSPKKTKTAAWLQVMAEAQRLGLYTSASMVFGFGEEPRHRISSLTALRDAHDRSIATHGLGFLAFISWPLQHESRYGHVFGELKGLQLGGTEEEYLRHTSFCRVFLDNIPHFQASWPTMGLDVAERALRCGCDDMGGTMMEENVVSQAGSVHCSVSEQQVRKTIERAGLEARKRDSWYRLLEPGAAGAKR